MFGDHGKNPSIWKLSVDSLSTFNLLEVEVKADLYIYIYKE